MKALLGKKLGMTQVFADEALVPVTVIEAGPCVITQVKTEEKEGYAAVQIAYGDIKPKNVTKPLKGHFDKAKAKPARYLRECRLDEGEPLPAVGTKLSCDIFQAGDVASITAVSKGKGFQGVVKRHGFAGGPGGHGSHFHRAPGSIGMAATPSRVFKGTRMPGQMGDAQVTIKSSEIVKIDPENNMMLIKGAVPGGKGALLVIKATGKTVKPVNVLEVRADKPEQKTAEKPEKEKAEEIKQEEAQQENAEKTAEEKVVEEKSAEVAEEKTAESPATEAPTEEKAAEVKEEKPAEATADKEEKSAEKKEEPEKK